ncbi:NAD-dependent epimerase/dehydratase family protein [Brevibacterium yomogidense]|uniref:NAD-dependent epimerase/dehydratase family protein n=1 Tax=Brevibacterium yomogidense TaxID=946573 RepID=UPI000B34C7AD|nr:NAD(P)-dependent oxidoreductase [Brevibacterium yomogidense]
MKVVVTGASGYIGRHVVDALLQMDDIQLAALTRHAGTGNFRDLCTGEIGSLSAHFSGADHIIHLAGRLVDKPEAGVTEYFNANVKLTEDVVLAAASAGTRSVVHASSRLVYPRTLTSPADEVRDIAPDTAYGISKRWAEELVQHYSSRCGFSALSLRIAQVTGGDHPGLGVINSFIRQAREHRRITVNGKGVALREFVHVEDVADAIVSAIKYRGPWQGINVGGTRAVSVREIADMVARSSAHPECLEVRSVAVAEEDTSCYALKHDRAKQILRWEPRWAPDDIIANANQA